MCQLTTSVFGITEPPSAEGIYERLRFACRNVRYSFSHIYACQVTYGFTLLLTSISGRQGIKDGTRMAPRN